MQPGMKFSLLRVNAAPFSHTGMWLFLLLPPSLVPARWQCPEGPGVLAEVMMAEGALCPGFWLAPCAQSSPGELGARLGTGQGRGISPKT